MTSLGALGGAFFRGGLVRKVVTAYSGNSFPTYTPNPIFRRAYESGEVEVEHW
jgi:acyl CoA:acetate/3-ketoacid CoA transferase alpha subunit